MCFRLGLKTNQDQILYEQQHQLGSLSTELLVTIGIIIVHNDVSQARVIDCIGYLAAIVFELLLRHGESVWN